MNIKFNDKTNFFLEEDNFKKNQQIKSELILDSSLAKDPILTIAIPTYKRPVTLETALKSALNQRGNIEYEIIIVDNDNNSKVETILKKYTSDKLKYFRNSQNLGMFGNWNRCFELANGKYVSLLHDDDFLKDNYTMEIMQLIKKSKPALISISDTTIDEVHGVTTGTIIPSCLRYKQLNKNDFFYFHPISNVGTVYNKGILLSEGGFSEKFFPISDYIMNYNIVTKFGGIKILKILGYSREGFNESVNPETICNTIFGSYFFRKQLGLENKYHFPDDLLNKILFAGSLFRVNYDEIKKAGQAIIKSKSSLFIFFIIAKIIVRIKLLISFRYHSKIKLL